MRTLLEKVATRHTPDSLAARLRGEPGRVLLRTAMFEVPSARHSIVAARPFLRFRSEGSRCETRLDDGHVDIQFGNPWSLLDSLITRFELLDEVPLPFPLGGAFGSWGYDLKHFVEPRLSRHAVHDLELPDCDVGFHASLVVFDHLEHTATVVSTGLRADGERSEERARADLRFWKGHLGSDPDPAEIADPQPMVSPGPVRTSFPRERFLEAVHAAQRWIRSGDIYQVNLSQRLDAPWPHAPWEQFRRLVEVSPSPFAAFLEGEEECILSSSPELFLRLSGSHATTRPIKGTRPRSDSPELDSNLTRELLGSEKERSELVMITDLLRNDLGRVSAYGSVRVPELARLERYRQVQHLVSTIESEIRPGLSHLDVLQSCFPGGSITGAPKIRAMEIIDHLEPVARGPYTGCIGYLGFNRESQLSITIRTVVLKDQRAWFHVGAGIVADSDPTAEHEETWAKAGGILAALGVHR